MTPQFSLADIASYLDGELQGDSDYLLSSLATLTNAKENEITFVAQDKYLTELSNCSAGAVVLKREHSEYFSGNKILVTDPYLCFAKLSAMFDPPSRRNIGVHASAVIDPSAQIASSASIGANVVIGSGVVIGEHTEIYPNVTIAENVRLGSHCLIYSGVSLYSQVSIGDYTRIHSGTVIGSDGFGFAPTAQGWQKIHQLGGVKIGSHVEIGANTAIDRGALTDTIIGDHVIIDNLVHIAHNVVIGEATAIAGCVGIAGSAVLGKRCIVAGAVAINGHIEIADNTQFNGGTIVTKGNREPGIFASAPPMLDVRQWRKTSVRYSQLDSLFARVKELEKKQKSE